MTKVAKKYTYGTSSNFVDVIPNTFIGGVGGVINTPSLLSAEIGVDESEILGFTIISNNILCRITVNYSFAVGAFLSDNTLTWYIDKEGKVTEVGKDVMENSTSVKWLYFPNAVQIGFNGGQAGFNNMENVTHLNAESAYQAIGRNTLEGFNIRILRLPAMVNLTNNYPALQNLIFLERCDLRNVTSMPISYAYTRYFDNVKHGCKFYMNSVFDIADRNSWAAATFDSGSGVGDTCTINGLVYTGVAGTPTADGEFDNSSGNQNTRAARLKNAINNDTRVGTLGKVTCEASFTSVGLISDQTGAGANAVTLDAGTIFTTISGSTFKGGNDLHKTLMDWRDKDLCTIVFPSGTTDVDPPSSLSYSNLTASSVELNFVAPTANVHGNDGYEVWIDDGTVYRNLFEYAEISSSGSVLDLTGIAMSGLKIKIRTIDGHFNYSAFSNEITLP